jgi:hypothetical protein
MSKKFHHMSKKFGDMSKSFRHMSKKFGDMSKSFRHMSKKFDDMTRRFHHMSKTFDDMTRRFHHMSKKPGDMTREFHDMLKPSDDIKKMIVLNNHPQIEKASRSLIRRLFYFGLIIIKLFLVMQKEINNLLSKFNTNSFLCLFSRCANVRGG